MTQLPSYTTQLNVITEAYIEDKIRPMDGQFCFCGTLSPDRFWAHQHLSENNYSYIINEYGRMEKALFSKLKKIRYLGTGMVCGGTSYTEDELFNGMCAALEVLKQIHREHGEVIDDAPVFKKRQIVNN